MRNNILLSICILTYNQFEKIKRFLLSIESQITPEIEIVIQDDSTDDKSKKLVEKLKQFSKKSFKIVQNYNYQKNIDGILSALAKINKF